MTMEKSRSDNGYIPSILQQEESCYFCGRQDRKLDRHEVFGGAYRQKSKAYGLWVLLCHEDCHEGRHGVHGDPANARWLKRRAQTAAMIAYGWSIDEFRNEFGKNYIED